MKRLYLFLLWWGVLFTGTVNAQVIVANTIQGNGIDSFDPYTGGVLTADPHALYNVIELGPGLISGIADNTYIASNWNTTGAIDEDNYYFEFSIAAEQPEYLLNFASFTYSAQRSADGPSSFALRSSINNFATNIGVFTADNLSHTISLSAAGFQGQTDIIFRVYGWSAADVAGTFSINDFSFNGTVNSSYSLTTGLVSPSTFNVTCAASASGTVAFSAVGDFSGNVYTAQLSDAAGNFGSPLTIGSLTSDGTSGTINITIPAGTGSSAGYKIRVVSSNAAITGNAVSVTVNGTVCTTTLATDYFRSRLGSGNWSTPSSWESSHAAGGPWSTATLAPGANATSVQILSAHTMAITTTETVSATQVSGVLQLLNNSGSNLGIMTLNNGAGDDLTINNGGVFQVVSNNAMNYTSGGFVYAASSNINVLTGGKILIGDGTGAHSSGGFDRFGIELNTKVYWRNGSILEWNTSGVQLSTSNTIYFPNTTAAEIPTLRLTVTPGTQLGGNTPTTINGLLEVNTNTSFGLIGLKIFRNGITGNTSTLTLNAATNGYTISGADGGGNATPAIIGGQLNIVLNEHLRVSKGVTIPSGAIVTMSNTLNKQIQKAAGSLLIHGSLDLNTISVTNVVGDVTVVGTLKTSNVFGLYGAGACVISGSLNLNSTSSTIEYKAAGPQTVQGLTVPLYYNLTISGSGTKTLQSANTMTGAGTITIAGTAVFDAGIHTIGSPTTRLTMTGTSQFRMAGGSTKPDAGGTYTLLAGTLIEFNGTSATDIRLGSPAINYASMVVSGTNVSNPSAGTGIRFQAGGFFTVKSGASFHLASTSGLGGALNSAISGLNNPTITLESNSTVDYNGAAQNITGTADYGNLTLSGSGIKTAPLTLTLAGNFVVSAGTSFSHSNGIANFNGGSAQSIYSTSSSPVVFYTLVNNNSIGLSADTTFHISNLLTLGPNSKLNLNDSIVLLSKATGTARVDNIPATAVINYTTGRFVVERYVPSHSKAWQLLATPVQSEQTIRSAWQEGNAPLANAKPGYGTLITSNIPGNGFDILTPAGPTMKVYDPATNLWDGVSNTLTNFISNPKGYMLFVRGDRSVQTSVAAPTATILRTTGKIYDSTTLPAPVTIPGGKFATLGNPFASPIDLTKLNRSNPADIQDVYYVWDPQLTTGPGTAYGLGGFRTLVRSGADYIVTPSGGSYPGNTKYIQSGQAFFARSMSTGGTITFDEDDKASVVTTVTRNPVDEPQQLATDLYVVSYGDEVLIDGVLAQFDKSYANAVDQLDAIKLGNTGENISIFRNANNIVVERRATIVDTDTIFYNLGQLRQQHYRLKFSPQRMDNLNGYLVDRFLNTTTEVMMNDAGSVEFAVTSDPLSAAADRFFLVFKTHAPVNTVIGIQADDSRDVVITWRVSEERNINNYEVARSMDGVHFSKLSTQLPAGNNGNMFTYQYTDRDPVIATTYYRVKGVVDNGTFVFSAIAKVEPKVQQQILTIAPNPVTGKIMHLQFKNYQPGDYRISLTNALGQVVYSNVFRLQSGETNKAIDISTGVPAGAYRLQLTGSDNSGIVQKIIIQ